jgi:hypothetical protein
MECTASENNDAEPVNNQPIVLTTAFVALLNDRDKIFFRKIKRSLTQELQQ